MARRSRRRFSHEFKAETVKLIRDSDKSIGAICQELDLSVTAVRRWVKQLDIDEGKGPAGALTTDELEELRRLRKEVRVLRQEREILKEATAFFAKENQ
jgi:transposase